MTNTMSKAFVTLVLVAAVVVPVVAPATAQAQTRKRVQSKAGQRAQTRGAAEHYSCPMHPEETAAKSGRCPKCGMDLRLTPAEPRAAADLPAGESLNVSAPTDSRMMIPDVEVLDQDGRTVHFYSDLVKGRVVVINFIFTTCTTICPPLGATFSRVQKDLGARAGRDVQFISISVDPATDTPERLKAWGAKFQAGTAWTFITGRKPLISELLRALGAASASPQDHSPTVLIGNDARGQWTRSYGLAPPSKLVQLINDAVEGRLDATEKEGARQ
jgi:protein SCO1